jgi:acyl-CoA thioesterase-1
MGYHDRKEEEQKVTTDFLMTHAPQHRVIPLTQRRDGDTFVDVLVGVFFAFQNTEYIHADSTLKNNKIKRDTLYMKHEDTSIHSPIHQYPDCKGMIIAVGDSLTAGFGVAEEQAYPARLERKLRNAGYDFRLINAGINGEKSGEVLSRIDTILSRKPDIVILQTGTNDGLRGVHPEDMERNIDAIVHSLLEHKVTVVLAGMQNLKRRKGDYDELFARVYPNIAGKHGLILIPFFLAGVAGEPHLNRNDGIHPTAEGYQIIADSVYPYVLQSIEKACKRN